MTQNGDFSCETLEERYATEHVGGAFNAKIIPKPLPVDQALKDATLGAATAETSQYLEGADFEPYIKHDTILPENKRHRTFTPAKPSPVVTTTPGSIIPKVFVPSAFPLFGPIPQNAPPPPTPIFWNTDPDIWQELTGSIPPGYDFIGQIYWDSQHK